MLDILKILTFYTEELATFSKNDTSNFNYDFCLLTKVIGITIQLRVRKQIESPAFYIFFIWALKLIR